MKKYQKKDSFTIPKSDKLYPIEQDNQQSDPMFGMNVHKVDPSDTTAFSYHIVESVADGTTKEIIVPFSINSIQCQTYMTNRSSVGSMGTGSQGCHYIDNTGLGAVLGVSTTRMIALGVGTVTCTINGRILTIVSSGVGATITTILTFFA